MFAEFLSIVTPLAITGAILAVSLLILTAILEAKNVVESEKSR